MYTEALLQDYLLSNDIQVLSCFTAKSWLRQDEKDQVTSFRVSVALNQKQKIFDLQLWSEDVIIRNWRFKQSSHGEYTYLRLATYNLHGLKQGSLF